ncbi:MAG: choice-of-anchor J domain-containing protein [Alloprevotella sp.]|nr:choice-of-anchor J domain-containing protein [Alloprevotella sp.]
MKRTILALAYAALCPIWIFAQAVGDALVPPFTEDFSTPEGFDRFSVINANGDMVDDTTAVTWYFDADRLTASYTYNKLQTTIGADDWLITPPLQLEGGRSYTLTFQAWSANGNRLPERLEVRLGTAATVEGMTQSIMAPTLLQNATSSTRIDFSFDNISIPENGVYYIGFHAMSDPDHFRLMLDDISLTANPFDAAPAEVTDLKATAAAKGALQATISFKAPTLTVEGGALSSLSRIEVMRGETPVHTFTAPAPGEVLSCEDTAVPESGLYTYSVTAYNDSGFGGSVEATTYVGIDTPLRPQNAIANDRQTSVGLTWDAVSETGVNGGYVDPAQVQYVVYTMEGGYVVDELLMTAAGAVGATVEQNTEEGSQELRQFAIAAVNEAGKSDYGVAALVMGASYRLPFEEHFTGGETQNYWFRYSTAGITPVFEKFSADGDNSCYVLNGEQAGAEARFISGKISLRGAVNPTLLFHHQGVLASRSSLIVEVQKADGSVEALLTKDYSKLSGEPVWTQEVVSLEKYLGERYVLVSFHFVAGEAETAVALDNVRVMDLLEYDLSASISAPQSAAKGMETKLGVTVKNEGGETADGYRVRLLADGQTLLDQRVTEPLTAQAERTFNVGITIPPTTTAETVSLQATVDFDYDLNDGNNTAEATVLVKSSGYPTAENLQATSAAGGVTLTWAQPSSTSRLYTEDFEGDAFTPFSIGGIAQGQKEGQIGDWRLYDGDNAITFQFDREPMYENAGGVMAWQVFEPRLAYDMTSDLKRGYLAHSGERYLISVQATDGGYNASRSDDWLISPRLSGEEQEISFFAKEVSTSFEQEHFELYYSTTGPNILNFISCGEGRLDSEKWTELKFTVPAGTRYFAIRKVTEDGFGMFVDDFTYRVTAGAVTEYRIYRDNELIGSVAGDDVLRYLDTTGGEHDYAVTVVYSDGTESDAVSTSTKVGISVIGQSDNSQSDNCYDLQGRRVRSAQQPKGVYIIGQDKVLVK